MQGVEIGNRLVGIDGRDGAAQFGGERIGFLPRAQSEGEAGIGRLRQRTIHLKHGIRPAEVARSTGVAHDADDYLRLTQKG